MDKLFMTAKDGPAPKPRHKKHADPLDKLEDWMKLKAFILSGKAKPQETVWFKLLPHLDTITGVNTARTARERMMKFLRDAGLESEYSVRMITPEPETNPEYQAMLITYEPPFVVSKKKA